MSFRDTHEDLAEGKYISKKVMVNGQLVTLYSTNGQTWLSSPEDLPALMDRLENARITLNTQEKVAEGEGAKVAKPEQGEQQKEKDVPERPLSTKYRMKGPRPRPILRQNGVVIEGPPLEPISASSAVMSFSSDVPEPAQEESIQRTAKVKSARKAVKAQQQKRRRAAPPVVTGTKAAPSKAKPSVAPRNTVPKTASKAQKLKQEVGGKKSKSKTVDTPKARKGSASTLSRKKNISKETPTPKIKVSASSGGKGKSVSSKVGKSKSSPSKQKKVTAKTERAQKTSAKSKPTKGRSVKSKR